ncbi:MAG: FAD-binding oxidoreductase [Elusimicrobiota bacterium]
MPKKLKHKKSKIINKHVFSSNIVHFRIQEPEISEVCQPGQFIHILVNNKYLRRPISIFSKQKDSIDIIFKICGQGTLILSKLNRGEYIDILGPLGNGFPIKGEKPLFVAGGLGVAPLNFLALEFKTPGVFIYGTKNNQDLIDLSHLEGLNHKLIILTEEKDDQLVTNIISPHVNETDFAYLSGPREMLKAASSICKKNNKPGYVTWEERMGCGTGLCQSCAVKTLQGYKLTCSQGPVFKIGDIDWNEY